MFNLADRAFPVASATPKAPFPAESRGSVFRAIVRQASQIVPKNLLIAATTECIVWYCVACYARITGFVEWKPR